jgi:23S rRNA G2445 N2-methylase RlmL
MSQYNTLIGSETIIANIDNFGGDIRRALVDIAEEIAPQMTGYAKQNARWTDRTGNARRGLGTTIRQVNENTVDLIIAYNVPYGIWLEVKHAGRYAILMESIQATIPTIRAAMARKFG